MDGNESPDLLRAHVERNGFEGHYAISPSDVTQQIGSDYGQSFLNPPNAPMLLVRPDNSIVPLPFGVKSVDQLASFVDANRLQ
ncbi:MAG: hypothetical protein ACPGWR_32685 [Ardenticatenaceae bacterium]